MANLITLEEYKISEGIESLKDNARIETLITAVSQLVKTYCANSFVDYYEPSYPKVETISIDWETFIVQLTESPVVDIVTVEERANYGSAYVTLTEAAKEFYFDDSSDVLYRTSSTGWKNWAMGPGAVKVTYTAGYATIPDDLKLAVVDLITYYHKDEYKERRTIGSASMANQTTSSQWRNVGFPDHIKRILDLYKQVQM